MGTNSVLLILVIAIGLVIGLYLLNNQTQFNLDNKTDPNNLQEDRNTTIVTTPEATFAPTEGPVILPVDSDDSDDSDDEENDLEEIESNNEEEKINQVVSSTTLSPFPGTPETMPPISTFPATTTTSAPTTQAATTTPAPTTYPATTTTSIPIYSTSAAM